jgi:type I restriction enzyme M protein
LDDKREKVAEDDIHDVLRRWGERDAEKDTDRTAKAFFVPVEEIVENGFDLSINRYKEVAYEEVEYEKPEVILARLRDLQREIDSHLDTLASHFR